MNWNNVFTVFRKELLDLMRDRRTIFFMVVFPVVLFPVLTVGFHALERRARDSVKKQALDVMLLGEENAPALAAELRQTEGLNIVPAAADFRSRISDKKIRAAVEFQPGLEQQIAEGKKPAISIYMYATEMRSEDAASRLERAITRHRDTMAKSRLAGANLPEGVLRAVETKRENVASAEKVGGSRMAIIVPYFLIILCLTGALHPAMDVTAGEKERGTLETLLASAVGRRDLVLGKFLLVVASSLLTAVVAIASFFFTMQRSPEYVAEMTGGKGFNIGAPAILTIFLVVLPLAIFFAGMLLCLSLFAKSYKEAQSYTTPLLIGSYFPAIIAMLPGVEINPLLAFVPILNVSLVAKEVLVGNYPWVAIFLTFGATCGFAAIAMAASVYLFRKETVLFRS